MTEEIKAFDEHLENMMRSEDAIDKLKENWKKDPCWDIEDTEGFENHREELLAWRIEYESRVSNETRERNNIRVDFVRGQTGVLDSVIVSSLYTWNEIEGDLVRAEAGMSIVEIGAAQVRATLLQAAQLKRIADVLERKAGE